MKGSKRNRNGELIVAEVTLRKYQIPEYLKQGELYRTLMENNDDQNEKVTFPKNVLKQDIQVDSLEDCDHLLNSLRFWGVDGVVSKEIISYVLTCCKSRKKIDTLLQKFETEFKFVFWLRQMMRAALLDRSRIAIQSGMIELVEFVNKKIPFPADACGWAAESGNLEVMEFLCKNGCRVNYSTGKIAAWYGHTSILQFLVHNAYSFDIEDLISAVEGGHLECVKFICLQISLDQIDTVEVCNAAAEFGHLEILQYLHSAGFDWDENTTDYAARGGHLHCLQYLHEQGCEWSDWTCAAVAREGHLHCLQYAHQHGASFDNAVVEAAVVAGHLDCLQYAYEHGCAWTYVQSRSATRAFILVNGCIVERYRTPHSSSLVWDYLRIHTTNA